MTGGTGSGKTTLLSALLGEGDPADRLVLCEDAAELTPAHPHVVRLLTRPPNVEGVGSVTLRDLVRQALRMRPDRLVVGEVRGAEVTDLLAALNTGHDGGCGTLHANRPAEVPARLEALGVAAGLDRAAVHSQAAAALSRRSSTSAAPPPVAGSTRWAWCVARATSSWSSRAGGPTAAPARPPVRCGTCWPGPRRDGHDRAGGRRARPAAVAGRRRPPSGTPAGPVGPAAAVGGPAASRRRVPVPVAVAAAVDRHRRGGEHAAGRRPGRCPGRPGRARVGPPAPRGRRTRSGCSPWCRGWPPSLPTCAAVGRWRRPPTPRRSPAGTTGPAGSSPARSASPTSLQATTPRVGRWAGSPAAVLLSGRTGCSLAEVVSAVEDDLRARHRHDLELRAATAGPRAGGAAAGRPPGARPGDGQRCRRRSVAGAHRHRHRAGAARGRRGPRARGRRLVGAAGPASGAVTDQ